MFLTAEAPDRKSMLVHFNRTERQNTDSYFGKKVGAFCHQTRISTVIFQISYKPSALQISLFTWTCCNQQLFAGEGGRERKGRREGWRGEKSEQEADA